MRTYLIATRNYSKTIELRQLLDAADVPFVTLSDYPDAPEVDETADTYEGNAALKSMSATRHTGLWSIADDTGLEVDHLDGRPGVYSARYSGIIDPTGCKVDRANRCKLIQELHGVPKRNRGARFVCVLSLTAPDGTTWFFRGECRGSITESLHPMDTDAVFGYDSIFRPKGSTLTFSDMPMDRKNQLSHRGIAARALVSHLATLDPV